MEVWKEVNDYEKSYQVSSEGNVRGIERHSKKGLIKSKMIKHSFGRYCRVLLTDNESKGTSFLVHRLVANAFIENPFNKPQINHINGIKTDNRVENLEWVTQSENMNHAFKTGLATAPKGDVHYAKKNLDFINAKSKAVINTETNVIYSSISKASKACGFCSKDLARKLLGTRKNNTPFSYYINNHQS